MEDGHDWTQEQLALLADARLPTSARIIGLIVSLGPPEGIELRFDDVRAYLGPNDAESDDSIRRHMRRLEATGWVERTPGGRGHGDTFRILMDGECGANAPLRLGTVAALTERIDPHQHSLSDRVGSAAGLNMDRVGSAAGLSPPSSSSTPSSAVSSRARAREADEPGGLLHPDAAAAIEQAAAKLAGCRGALRDYLVQRVEPELQYGYVQRVVTSLDGRDEWMWSDRRGSRLSEDRVGVLAGALNELAASTETGKHFHEEPGGFGNLRSKVRYLVASRLGAERDATRPDPTARLRRTTIGIENQGEFRDRT